MKKVLSILLSIIITISIATGLGIDAYAMDNTVSTAYQYKIGNTISVFYDHNTSDIERYYYFTAPATDWYEFEITNPFYYDGDYHSYISVTNSNGQEIAFGATNEYTGKCVAIVKLTANKKYYVEIDNFSESKDYTIDFVSRLHKHKLDKDLEKAEVESDEYGFYGYTGYAYYECKNCDYTKTEKIVAVKSVSLSSTKYTCDGKVKKPSVKVIGVNGKAIPTSNYTVTYPSGRKNVGKYTVKIAFKGNYTGVVKRTFTIIPKSTSVLKLSTAIKGFTVKWKKQATQTTGYQIQYSTSSKFSSAKTVTVSSKSATSKKITGLTAKKKYYVRVRTYKIVSGKKYYSSWSSAKTVTTKAAPAPKKKTSTSSSTSYSGAVYVTPTGKRYHYDGHCNGGTYIKSTLSDAKGRGLTPCKKCVG